MNALGSFPRGRDKRLVQTIKNMLLLLLLFVILVLGRHQNIAPCGRSQARQKKKNAPKVYSCTVTHLTLRWVSENYRKIRAGCMCEAFTVNVLSEEHANVVCDRKHLRAVLCIGIFSGLRGVYERHQKFFDQPENAGTLISLSPSLSLLVSNVKGNPRRSMDPTERDESTVRLAQGLGEPRDL